MAARASGYNGRRHPATAGAPLRRTRLPPDQERQGGKAIRRILHCLLASVSGPELRAGGDGVPPLDVVAGLRPVDPIGGDAGGPPGDLDGRLVSGP
jgi:hypothetical protein